MTDYTTEEILLKSRIEYLEGENRRLVTDCLEAADIIATKAAEIKRLEANARCCLDEPFTCNKARNQAAEIEQQAEQISGLKKRIDNGMAHTREQNTKIDWLGRENQRLKDIFAVIDLCLPERVQQHDIDCVRANVKEALKGQNDDQT